jgi:hypothetical protein
MMARDVSEIEKEIAAFLPVDGYWRPLDDLLAEALGAHPKSQVIKLFLSVLERFPLDDGAGVLWSIVHGLEHLGDYESLLLHSVRGTPSFLGIVMLGRMINAGEQAIDGEMITDVLRNIASRPGIAEDLRTCAQSFLRNPK